MHLTVITTPEEFAALGPSWGRLQQRCSRNCVFLTHEWFDAAWQWRQRDACMHMLCCWEDDELVGVLPMVCGTAPRAGRECAFLAVPDTQICDLIAADEHVDAVAAAFADELSRCIPEWDVLRLRYLPATSTAATAFAAALAARGFPYRANQATINPVVALDDSWDAYYATRSRRLKKSSNLIANRLAKAGEIVIEWLEPGYGTNVEVDRAIDVITGISASSWKKETGNSLENPGPQAFIRRLSRHARERGWLSIWTLRVDGRPLAMEYQLIVDGNVHALRSDFNAVCAQISPGSHLSRHLLQQLFGRGLNRYFMGPGNNAYKYRWTERAEPVWEMFVYSRSLRGRMLALWELTLRPFARRVRDRVRRLWRVTSDPGETRAFEQDDEGRAS
ncbi:MAG: GNAT family N-acetyltransferase [Aromatoleum sp.]|nr:GNAT family N-acetyltransferase [Aromatoleum sp.]